MIQKNNLIITKEKIRCKVDKAKKYYDDHKFEIALVSTSIIAIGYAVIIKSENMNLNSEIKNLKLNAYKDKKRINDLEELCDIKDQFFKKAISESLRHGGSFGAQQMAYKRHYS